MAIYKNYRQTNLLGLEILPSHWEVKKIKHLFSIGRGRVISQAELEDEGMYPVYSSQTHNDGCLGYINSYDFNCEQLTWTTDGANAGTVFLRKGKYNCTNVCGTLQPINKENVLQFYLYCLQHINQFHKRPDTNGAKIMNNEMAEIYIALPSNQEQLRITTFLNHETAKIDNLIKKQQQLIELLKEKCQAMISHAVTKGLNPDVPMKDSGVEWLGEIPQHWSITKGCYIGRLFGSESVSESSISDFGQLPFIKVSTLSLDSFTPHKPEWFVNISQEKNYNPETNYIVFPKRGSAIFTNKVNIIKEHSVIDPNLMGWKVNKNISNEYYAFVLKKRGLSDIADISTVPQINNKHIAPEKFPHPPYNEQLDIVNSLKTSLQDLDYLIGVVKKGIEYTQERRTALISAAVTGKIDLRNWTTPIPKAETPTEASA